MGPILVGTLLVAAVLRARRGVRGARGAAAHALAVLHPARRAADRGALDHRDRARCSSRASARARARRRRAAAAAAARRVSPPGVRRGPGPERGLTTPPRGRPRARAWAVGSPHGAGALRGIRPGRAPARCAARRGGARVGCAARSQSPAAQAVACAGERARSARRALRTRGTFVAFAVAAWNRSLRTRHAAARRRAAGPARRSCSPRRPRANELRRGASPTSRRHRRPRRRRDAARLLPRGRRRPALARAAGRRDASSWSPPPPTPRSRTPATGPSTPFDAAEVRAALGRGALPARRRRAPTSSSCPTRAAPASSPRPGPG